MPVLRSTHRIGSAAALAAALLFGAQSPASPTPPEPPTTLATAEDRQARMTVDVMINGQGPFPFAVDTGADRTSIAASLAERLRLAPYGTATLHDMAGVHRVRTVRIRRLNVGNRELEWLVAPVLPDASLGVLGLLGIDAVADQTVVMDFGRGRMTVGPSSSREPRDPDVIVVKAKRRFGQLVLLDASVDGRRVHAIVDSGSERTIGNSALRRLLERRTREQGSRPVEMVSVTGHTLLADEAMLHRMKIGGVTVANVPIAYSDAHPFRKFGLADSPAMLLGVDMLRAFDRVSLDFGSKKVRLLPKDAD